MDTRKIWQIDERFPKEGKRREKQSGVDVEYGIAGFEELREGEEQKQKKEKASWNNYTKTPLESMYILIY